jgi:hypothetical protein
MKIIKIIVVLFVNFAFSQENDSISTYKKRVLETIEIDFLSSYYNQDGKHSAVSGGIGTEDLSDFASNIVVSIPVKADGILTFDAGISAYTSASSSNINPFNSGASGKNDDDDNDRVAVTNNSPTGTPWLASSGASKQDVLKSLVVNYSHSSDNRNFIWNTDASFSNEYDYNSFGFGAGITKLFNDKNSEVYLKASAYLDQWMPIYATELSEFKKYGDNFQNFGYFQNVTVYNQFGNVSNSYLPSNFKFWNSNERNSFAFSIGFSQVLTQKLQFSVFLDILKQEGNLSSPFNRVYFADKNNFYIGNIQYLNVYQSIENIGLYQLADDIERLPNTRFKIPIGARINYYLNEFLTIRTYYRYYQDDWEISSHTANVELPIKILDKFTFSPTYRYYMQNGTKYFAPFEKHLSTSLYYTSDYDLSSFNAHQYGAGLQYTDIFTKSKIWIFGIKNIDVKYNFYNRSDGLKANIITFGVKFIQN